MKSHYLTAMLNPQSIAVIGASDKSFSLGQTVFANLLTGQYQGKLYPINLRHKIVGGLPAYTSVTKIKEPIDLAVVLTPVHTYLNIVLECSQKKVKAILLNNGSTLLNKEDELTFNQALALAKEKNIRILGPSFLGMMRPATGLNASTYSCQTYPGGLALVTQSSSLATAIVDWAERKEIGFSSLISVDHRRSDVSFGDILDYLAYDSVTQAVLLQVQHVPSGRRFISALRSLAREKPVVVIKSGLSENYVTGLTLGSKLISSHNVFQSALTRTGALFINTISEIFTSINALSNNFKVTDKRLAIISNGVGVGTLAKDRALKLGVEVANLSEETVSQINQALPTRYQPKEPIDILDNASPIRFKHVTQLCIEDKNVDGVLVILTPQMGTDHLTTARLMIDLQKQTKKPVYVSWLGETKVDDSYALFSKSHSACFRMPEHAIEAFNTLANYQRSQKLLSQIPSPIEKTVSPDENAAKKIITKALKEQYTVMPEHMAQQLLKTFLIDTQESFLTSSSTEAIEWAEQKEFPLLLKVDTPNLVDVVDFNDFSKQVASLDEIDEAYTELLAAAKKSLPVNSLIYGINISQPVVKKANQEVMINVVQDDTFGSVISFGESLYSTDSRPDYAIALPPLNDYLAQDLIAQTRIGQNTNLPKSKQLISHKELKRTLLMISQLVGAFPQIEEICLNPVWIEDKRVVLPSIKIVLRKMSAAKQSKRFAHMAIMPYPSYMSMEHKLPNGENVVIRPIMPEDASLLQNLVKGLSEESRYFRYLSNIKQLSQNLLARFTQLDYDREMVFVMIRQDEEGKEEMLGAARYTAEPDNISCEFAVEVADDWQGNGIATILMQKLFIAAKEQGLETMHGEVLTSNENMKKFVKKMGFNVRKLPEDNDLLYVEKNLSAVSDMMIKANLLANKVFERVSHRK